MKILVTGATGFIGRNLLPVLKEAGHDIVVLTRDVEKAVTRLPVLCRIVGWDPALLEPPEGSLDGVEAVVHLAGENIATRWTESKKVELERSRILSTHHIVQALKKMPNPPKVMVSISGIGFYGHQRSTELEESAPAGTGFLADLCRRWETEALEAQQLGIRTVVLRTGVVLGTDGGALQYLLPLFRMGLGGRCGSGKQWMSWIHVSDLARMILHALDSEALEGPVNAASPEPVTNKEFTRALGHAVHRPTWCFVPGVFLKILLGEAAGVVLDSIRVVPNKIRESGFDFEFSGIDSVFQNLCDVCTHELVMEQWVPQPIDTIFKFYSEAKNLETLTPPHLNFKVTAQSTPAIQEGTRINYRLTLHGIPFRWQSMIMDWHPPRRFSDIQVVGPYWLWHHTHDFIEEDGGTLIRDRAVYRLPFWTPGDLLGHPFVRRDLESIFQYRWNKTRELFGE